MTDTSGLESPRDPADPLIGARIGLEGRFVIQAKLGEGGMGAVYRAFDDRRQRLVAIKIFTREGADRIDTERFRREGLRFGTTLRHPNIVRIHGFHRSRTSHTFIASELIVGRTLSEVVERSGPMPIDKAVGVIRQVADGLEFAHRFHIVHRDLKPSNIMIRDDDREAVILDFGIAKDLAATVGMTRGPAYLGTPGYSAPEQDGGNVDGRTDVFSLGVVFYEIVTGKFAFEGRDDRELRLASRTLEPPPAAKLNPAVGTRLSAVIAKMMDKSPRRRHQEIGEVIADLDALGGDG